MSLTPVGSMTSTLPDHVGQSEHGSDDFDIFMALHILIDKTNFVKTRKQPNFLGNKIRFIWVRLGCKLTEVEDEHFGHCKSFWFLLMDNSLKCTQFYRPPSMGIITARPSILDKIV